MPLYTKSTSLKSLRPRDLKPLQDMLDVKEDKYKMLAASIKKRNGKDMFSTDEIESLSLQFMRRSSPSKEIFSRWKYDNPNICDLLTTLRKCKLFREAEYILSEVLKESLPSISAQESSDSETESGVLNCPCRYDAPLRFISNPQQHDETATHNQYLPEAGVNSSSGEEVYSTKTLTYESSSTVESVSLNDSINPAFRSVVPVQYEYEQVSAVTNNFDEHNIIGSGGFAKVYLGRVDGQKIAVKRMTCNEEDSDVSEAQFRQFRQEMEVLSHLHHSNLLVMYGHAVGNESESSVSHYCIVYEYMENGSLEDRLSCKMGTGALSVALRLRIIKETADGIHFIHKQGFVHRDIKSANILLDADFTAKVGDCGLVREGPAPDSGKSIIDTDRITGTLGYVPPEYLEGKVSNKMDAFAFGVVLLEVLTGMPCLDNNRVKRSGKKKGEKYLRRHVIEYCADGGKIWDLRDIKCDPWREDTVESLYTLARALSKDDRRERMSICEVVPKLEELQ